MKKIFALVSILLLASLIAGCGAPAPTPTPTATQPATPAPKPLQLRVLSSAVETAPQSQALKFLMEKITQKSKGTITFGPIWWGTIGSAGTFEDLVSKGAVDILGVAYGYRPSMWPLNSFENACIFGPTDPLILIKAKRATQNAFPVFDEYFKKANVEHLMNFPFETYSFFSQKPYKTVADLKGQKIGAYGIFPKKAFDAVGAVQVASTMMQFYEQLRSGVIDACHLMADVGIAYKLQEAAKYWDVIPYGGTASGGIMINLDLFKSLTPEQQRIFKEAGLETELTHAQWIIDQRATVKKAITDAGVTIVEMPAEELRKWVSACEDVGAWWAGEEEKNDKLPVAWDILKRYTEECEKLGFNWPRKWAVR